MLKPPTPDQIEEYDVCEENGDRFYVTDTVHMQCQWCDSELYVHNISVAEGIRNTGVGRSTLTRLRAEHPDARIVANGVEWLEPAGRFWKAMVEEGLIDKVMTYEHGDIEAADIETGLPSP